MTFQDAYNCHMVLSKLEWIGGAVYTGSNVYIRDRAQGCKAPHFLPNGYVRVFSRLYKWTGAYGSICAESGIRYAVTAPSPTDRYTPTFNWSSAPWGPGYYGTDAWGSHYDDWGSTDGTTGEWFNCGPVWSGYLYVSDMPPTTTSVEPETGDGTRTGDGTATRADRPPPPDRLPPRHQSPFPPSKRG